MDPPPRSLGNPAPATGHENGPTTSASPYKHFCMVRRGSVTHGKWTLLTWGYSYFFYCSLPSKMWASGVSLNQFTNSFLLFPPTVHTQDHNDSEGHRKGLGPSTARRGPRSPSRVLLFVGHSATTGTDCRKDPTEVLGPGRCVFVPSLLSERTWARVVPSVWEGQPEEDDNRDP